MDQPGQVLWAHYETSEPFTTCESSSADTDGCNHGGSGDNILRLINPTGSANADALGGSAHPICAMIYVFDDDQEMGECCGCPLTSAGMTTFSVDSNLLANFIRGGEPNFGNGAIAIIAAGQNLSLQASPPAKTNGKGCTADESGACNDGCDPTNFPGYVVTTDNNLLGSITHNQVVSSNTGTVSGLTEVPLSDDRAGDANTLNYLQLQCGVLVGNAHGGGTCSCPVE